MKKSICYFLLIAMIFTLIPVTAYAEQESEAVIVLDDGGYILVSISVVENRAGYSKNASKTYTYYSSDGTAKWKATLSGSFTYTGNSSTCTSSSCSVSSFDSAWYTISKSSSKSGSSAMASVTMGYKVLGVTVNKASIDITLTCDKDGNLS